MCAGSGLHVLLWSMLSTSIQYHLLGTVGFENQQSLQCDAQRHANAHSGNARQGARNRVGWKQQGHKILTLTLDLLVHVLSKKVCDWTHEWLTWHTHIWLTTLQLKCKNGSPWTSFFAAVGETFACGSSNPFDCVSSRMVRSSLSSAVYWNMYVYIPKTYLCTFDAN